MATDKPPEFPNDERTVFIPNPSGRAPTPMSPSASTPYQSPQTTNNNPNVAGYTSPQNNPQQPYILGDTNAQHLIQSGINPLVKAAAGLIALPAQLLTMPSYDNVDNLRAQILDKIKIYENDTRAAGIDTNINYTGRYIICTFIDEAVLNTIWGSDSIWTNQSLLSTLHNETSGGETFFVILDRLLQDPNGDLDLLELIFICMSLGFKGKYAVIDRGYEKLEEKRNIVYDHIRRRRGDFPMALSSHWQSPSNQKNTLRNFIPLWVVAAVASALLLSVFLGFTLVLDESTDPVYESLNKLAKYPEVNTNKINTTDKN